VESGTQPFYWNLEFSTSGIWNSNILLEFGILKKWNLEFKHFIGIWNLEKVESGIQPFYWNLEF
jgi:hypothetical protein